MPYHFSHVSVPFGTSANPKYGAPRLLSEVEVQGRYFCCTQKHSTTVNLTASPSQVYRKKSVSYSVLLIRIEIV